MVSDMWHVFHFGFLMTNHGISWPAAIDWMSSLASVLVLLLVGSLVGAMIFIIKLTTDTDELPQLFMLLRVVGVGG